MESLSYVHSSPFPDAAARRSARWICDAPEGAEVSPAHRGGQYYCALMPAALMTLPESTISVSTKRLNSALLIGMGSAPSEAKRSLISADSAAVRTSRAILSTTSAGVPAGANNPTHSE